MNEAYPPLPPEIGRALDRLEGGALTWDPVLLRYLRARCFENPDGHTQFRHRRHLYRCETRSSRVQELLHPKTDVLAPGPLAPLGNPYTHRMQVVEAGSPEPDRAETARAFRDRCRAYLAGWHVGTVRSLTAEVRACARLLLEQDNLLPSARGPDREWASAWLDLAHEAAFQPTALSRRVQSARVRAKRRAERDLWERQKRARPGQTDEPVTPIDPDILWHAGPALELALLSPFCVFMSEGMVDTRALRGPPQDWIRQLIVTAWQILPPFWLRSRETCYEFRLGTERVPARVRYLFGPALCAGSFEFERLRPLFAAHETAPVTFEPTWLFGLGAASCPFGSFAIERMGILFEEILASCTPVSVPGGAGWREWEAHLPEALVEPLPFHLCPPHVNR